MGPVVEEPMVNCDIVCVSMMLLPPRSVNSAEILALPVSPFKRIRALEVAVVLGLSDGENVVLPNAKLLLTTGYGYITLFV